MGGPPVFRRALPLSAAEPRHDTIAQTLRDEILRGTYRPGDRLPAERELATRLGANRSSVREALRKLEQLGLVSIRHGGGARVCQLEEASLEVVRHMLVVDGQVNRPLLEELLDVHELLIAGAVRLAVERADDAELLRARGLLTRLADAATSDDEFIDAAAELIELVASGSQNRVLRLARNACNPLFSEPYREARKRFRPAPEVLAPLARALLQALVARDASAAEETVRQLLRLNRVRVLDGFVALAHTTTRPSEEDHVHASPS